ncbi:uncharacterized protein Z520_10737 [Fonsecaea multimorphosa CBS 102226]|uniref:Uncharacterized protein n=1 Tax=Fonsecaea multimorphosa CBS 102226 TaxID=1442371 RepID=A0A0D2JSU7_9EURO|nr:uncharacterized protein Z520_10737 [Fonsecaea multimorphosa CBS 102226]KIX93559.1 hypothetical protein Z520_10737 [Fonsecaea multimorphosa CBS 102226]
MMVNYAIDLLKAHQIRRENAFLHEELATLRKEMQDLKANRLLAIENEIKPIRESTTKASALVERHETTLKDQAREIHTIQQSRRAMQTEISDTKASYREIKETQQTHLANVEKQIEAVRAACQDRATAQQRHQHTLDSLENLQSALDGKADAAAVNLLETRINKLSSDQNADAVAVDSVSRVSDTAERRCSLHDPGTHPSTQTDQNAADLFAVGSVQVQDSQYGNHPCHETLGRLPPNQPREMTVPEDLDLDDNAHTISYAGHGCHVPQQNDSLKMLSPSTAQATQLAEIKTLRQRRFDGWDAYYNQGQKLVQALPHNFEGAIVRNFVDGLFKDTHRNQCQQWLDSSGWTWANVTVFGNLCSQLLADNASNEAVETETSARPRQIGAMLAAAGKCEQGVDGVKSKKGSKGKVARVRVDAPLRRSQRVAQKQNVNRSHTGQQPDVKSKGASPVHTADQDMAQGSKLETKPGNVYAGTQRQPQSDNAASPESRFQRAGAKTREVTDIAQPTRGTAISAEHHKSHKRHAAAFEAGQQAKRLKPSTARAVDHHDISVPQLVSFRERIDKSVEESSNDEVFLYNKNFSKPSIPAKRDRRTGHSKRGLPLPPPPEIPILPTTDEE